MREQDRRGQVWSLFLDVPKGLFDDNLFESPIALLPILKDTYAVQPTPQTYDFTTVYVAGFVCLVLFSV